ncbi:MAG: hypothetical protein JSV19_04400 [Phycisphaerales bacterium]|nr:MAG: hypothetical protein JSV19_04400 [Phycisphaerales bacterium]
MTCPYTPNLLRLVAGEPAIAERRDMQAHLATCAVCAREHARLIEVWQALGEWETDVAGIDLTARVLAEVSRESADRTGPARRFHALAPMVRAAASILIAVGLGIGAGYVLPLRFGETGNRSQETASAEAIVEALGLSHLGSDSATGLLNALDADSPSEGDESS